MVFDIFRWLERERGLEMGKSLMNFHTWNNQRFSAMKNSRMKWLMYLHCFQSFVQFRTAESSVHSPVSSIQCLESKI